MKKERDVVAEREKAKREAAAKEEEARQDAIVREERAKQQAAEYAARSQRVREELAIKAENQKRAAEFQRKQVLHDFSRLGTQGPRIPGNAQSSSPNLERGADSITPTQRGSPWEYPNGIPPHLRPRQPMPLHSNNKFLPRHPIDVPSPGDQPRGVNPPWARASGDAPDQPDIDQERVDDMRDRGDRRHGGRWRRPADGMDHRMYNSYPTFGHGAKTSIGDVVPEPANKNRGPDRQTEPRDNRGSDDFYAQFRGRIENSKHSLRKKDLSEWESPTISRQRDFDQRPDQTRSQTMSVSDWESASNRRVYAPEHRRDEPRMDQPRRDQPRRHEADTGRQDRPRDGDRRGRDGAFDIGRQDRPREGERRGREGVVDRSNRQRSAPMQRSRGFEDDDVDEIDYDHEAAEAVRAEIERKRREKAQKKAAKEAAKAADPQSKSIVLPEFITVYNLAKALGIKPELFVQDLGELGFENILHDSVMTGETAALVAAEYGFEPTVDTGDSVDLKPRPPPEDPSSVPPRPPIVTIMGHVDHGKTTMLDWLRKSSIAAGESGGITQHIGAFSVKMSAGKVITFLDTPGHSAFLTMRQRGANVTDIVILVVAADDSVMPQTVEALRHAQNAKVPIIVAINKCDIEGVNVDHVKHDLANKGVELEDFGGDVQVVNVSGKTGLGMDDLEENILALAESLDIRAEPDGMAEGWILEASVKKIGKVATVLVKRGTLRTGDYIVAGTTWAKIKTLRNEAGAVVHEAPPGTPVEIDGWKDAPNAGDAVIQAPEEHRASEAAQYRQEMADREKAAAQKAEEEQQERARLEKEALLEAQKAELEEGEEAVPEEPEDTGPKMVNFVVKGDVVGSVEAVCAAVMEIGSNEVRPRVLLSSAGQITESDVDHAATSKSVIINFNNVIPGHIKRLAAEANVKILDHTIIYRVIEDVMENLSEQLAPLVTARVLGEAEIMKVFPINVKARSYKNVAGIRVRTGQITRNAKYRVMRGREKVFDGMLPACP